MNVKKLALAALAGTVVILVLGGLWHQVVMGSFYVEQSEAVARDEPKMLFIFLGGIVLGLLMAWIYPMGYKGGSPVKEGARFGAVIGLLWILPLLLVFHGVWNVPLTLVIVDTAWHVIEEGLAGIAIAFVYGTGTAASSE